MSRYYRRDGSPYPDDGLLEWARDMERGNSVCLTMVGNVRVSTVWLGLDHAWMGGPPLIFETMIFGGSLDGEQERYSSEADARDGHKHWCDAVRESLS